MLLSFIIPVYNGEKNIEKSVQSVLKLKDNDIEVIVVDDGSTDKTLKRIERLAECDKRVFPILQENKGVSLARNRGLLEASGKYIAFVDSDDVIENNSYEQLLILLRHHDFEFVCCDYLEVNGDAQKLLTKIILKPGENDKKHLFGEILAGKANNVWCNIYNSKIIKQNSIIFPNCMKMGEDACFNIDYVKYCSGAFYFDKAVYCYTNEKGQSAMHKHKSEYIENYIYLFNELLKLHQMMPEVTFDARERYYLARLFGALFYSSDIISKKVKDELLESELLQYVLSFNYKTINEKIKKYFISHEMYKNNIIRLLISKLM